MTETKEENVPVPMADTGYSLLGLCLLFLIPSLLAEFAYFVDLQNNPILMRIVSVACMAGFLCGATLVLSNLRLRMMTVLGWSEGKCILLTIPIILLGPMFFHFLNMLMAMKMRKKPIAYWAFAGIIGGCGHLLSLFWSLAGVLNSDFTTGFCCGLCGILSMSAAMAAVYLLGNKTVTIPRHARVGIVALLLIWLGLQIHQGVKTIFAERLLEDNCLKAEKALGLPLRSIDKLTEAYFGGLAKTDGTTLKECAEKIDKLLRREEIRKLFRNSGEEARQPQVTKLFEDCQELFAEMDAACQGPLYRPEPDFASSDLFAQFFDTIASVDYIYVARTTRAIELDQKDEAHKCLSHRSWLLDSVRNLPSSSSTSISRQMVESRTHQIARMIERNMISDEMLKKEFDSLRNKEDKLLDHLRLAVWGNTVIYLRTYEASRKVSGNETILIAMQSFGGLIFSPLYYGATSLSAKFLDSIQKDFHLLENSRQLPESGFDILWHLHYSQAWIRVSSTTMAVELYRRKNGHLPEKLNDLVPSFLPAPPLDPFTVADTLKLEINEKKVTVSSAGHESLPSVSISISY